MPAVILYPYQRSEVVEIVIVFVLTVALLFVVV